MVVAAIVADQIRVRTPYGMELTPSTIVNSAGIFLLPAPGVIVVAFLGSLGGDLITRKVWFKTVFNTGQITVAYTAAALAWDWISGGGVDNAIVLYHELPGALLAAGISYALNTTFLSLVLAIARGNRVWDLWLVNYRSGLLPHLGMLVMGILFAGAWLLDFWAALLLSVPAGITWMGSQQIRTLEEKAQIEHELREKSDRLATRWEALAQIGERLSTTVDPKELVEVAAKVASDHCADAACVVAPGGGVATAVHADAPPQLRARLAASVATLDNYVANGVRAVPLRVGDQEVGTLYAAWDGGEPTPDQAVLLEPLADRVAIALQNTLLSAQAGEVEALREIDRMKGDLLASVSHELKTPIALMVGYGELLEKRQLENEQARWMGGKILSAGRHLTRLVDDLLDAGRLESGRFTLDRRLLDLRHVAEGAIETARVAHAGPRFLADLPPTPVVVEGDQSRLLQVLTNLLSNAARYGPSDGEIRLSIEPNGGHAVVGVEDQGPGVPPAERQRIFEKFYRAPGADRRSRKGLGLGLTIAHDLVVAHGGSIRVEDAPKRGARFVVELPRLDTRG
ncbi:MAG TPA: ATP-binding protein [Chloroflexota bacterium]|jgi:signal transduction histidine kinase|nr:ATP-binding protein [Chloroflexota bacterium]